MPRDLLCLGYTLGNKLLSFVILLGYFSSRLCVASACSCGFLPVVRACNYLSDLTELLPPAFVNLQISVVQANSLAILEPVVPVRSL